MSDAEERLEAIERRLAEIEQRLGIPARPPFHTPVEVRPEAPIPAPPVAQTPPPPLSTPAQTSSSAAPLPPAAELESIIGGHWLNRIGILAVLIGSAYFLKYAFENEWIGPKARVTIGIVAGIAALVWSERFQARGHRLFAFSLKVLGVGILYLSLWAASQFYHFIPNAVAFAVMTLVTAAMIFLALRHDAKAIAMLALFGGFLTPVLLSTGTNRAVELFVYVAILDAATLVLLYRRCWPGLLAISLLGTAILYAVWHEDFYTAAQLVRTVSFVTLFFAMFAVVPLIRRWEEPPADAPPIVLLVPFANALGYFIALHAIWRGRNELLAGIAVALAAVFVTIAAILLRQGAQQRLASAHLALAIGFITIAIPLRFDAHWITIGWIAEAAALLWASRFVPNRVVRALAIFALTLGVLRLLFVDDFRSDWLLLNMRMLTFALAVAVFAAIAIVVGRAKDHPALYRFAVIMLNLLALIALTGEVSDFFGRGAGAGYGGGRVARDFAYSAVWMTYGAGLMATGFRRRNSFLRWLALALIGITVGKVFLYDLSQLERVYRILSFIVLGVILLAISFAYQKKWLDLSP